MGGRGALKSGLDLGADGYESMNVGGPTEHGSSQTPLNLLQRSVTTRRHLSKVTRAHIRQTIRTVKASGVAAVQDSIEAALYVGAYAEIVRLREKLDGLDVLDKAYKPTVWSITKLGEVIAKFKSRKPSANSSRSGQRGVRIPPLRQPDKAAPLPSNGDGEAA